MFLFSNLEVRQTPSATLRLIKSSNQYEICLNKFVIFFQLTSNTHSKAQTK